MGCFFGCIFVLKIGWLTIPVCFVYYLLLSVLHNLSASKNAPA